MNTQKELSRVEKGIYAVIKHLERRGEQIHGFLIEKELKELGSFLRKPVSVIGLGTLYRALFNLEKAGFISSEWEVLPEGEKRPRRRYYKVAKQ